MTNVAKPNQTELALSEHIARFLGPADFPATGVAIAQMVRARCGPDHLLAALRRLTPGKVFHNVYEVWFDTLDGHTNRRTARTSGEAAQLSVL